MAGMTWEGALAHLVQVEPAFAVEETEIRGVPFRVFKNVPPHVPALMAASREAMDNGAADYLLYEGERLSYDAFLASVHRMAHILQKTFGLGQGARVALAMRNYPELLIVAMAISSIGGVVTFVNAWWTTKELDYAMHDSGAKLVFADGPRSAALAPLVEPLGLTLVGVRDAESKTEHNYSALQNAAPETKFTPPDIAPDDDFAIMYSSGTTGHPKGVVQTHRGAVNAVFSWLMTVAATDLMEPPDPGAPQKRRTSMLVITPLFHVTATHPLFLLSLPTGAQLTLMRKWDAEEAVRLIRDENITRFLGVPTQTAELLKAAKCLNETLPSLTYLGSGGAKRPAAQVAELAGTFPHAGVATAWGMTETNALGCGATGKDYITRPETAGRLHGPLQELRFLDDAGKDVPIGEIGELTVKSPSNMRCYLNKPEATAEVLKDGWLSTGDLGKIDEDGFITILDRKKNIIIRGGENIACLDVEGALHCHPNVSEACAFSVPHYRLGETVGAVIQTRSGNAISQKEMAAWLSDRIAKFKIPEHLWSQAEPLLRGATGKLDRRSLRSACLATL